jgi:hypothetical protein
MTSQMNKKDADARAYAPEYPHTRTNIHYLMFSATMIRELASVLRYTYIACLVKIIYSVHSIVWN